MCGTSMCSWIGLESHQPFVIAQDWGTRWHFTWQHAGPSSCVGLLSWSSSGLFLHGMTFTQVAIETFQKFRTPGVGEKMILEGNVFVEAVLPGATVAKADRRGDVCLQGSFSYSRVAAGPTWRFPNEIPIAGEPADVVFNLGKST